jgi:hypothetical protein
MRLKLKGIFFLINKEYIYLNVYFLLNLVANKPEYVKLNPKRSFFFNNSRIYLLKCIFFIKFGS